MDTQFVENLALTSRRYEAWWAHDMLDRPVVRLTRQRERPRWPLRPLPATGTIDDPSRCYLDPQFCVDAAENMLAMTDFYGDAIPSVPRGFNTGYLSLFCGARPRVAHDGATVWIDPCISDWRTAPEPVFDPGHEIFRAIVKVSDALIDNAHERYLPAVPDCLDAVTTQSMLRGVEDFCIDLLDAPGDVAAYRDKLVGVWTSSCRWWFDYDAARGLPGVMNWMGAFSTHRAGILQSDFSYMISPRMFETLVVPELEREAAALERCVYHWDGSGQVAHLPALTSIAGIDAIQWVPGAGQPGAACNPGPPLAAQKAGKSLVLYATTGELDTIFSLFRPQGLMVCVGFSPDQRPGDDDCRHVVQRFTNWAAGKRDP